MSNQLPSNSILTTKQLLIGVAAVLIIGIVLASLTVLPKAKEQDSIATDISEAGEQTDEMRIATDDSLKAELTPSSGISQDILAVALNPSDVTVTYDDTHNPLPALDGKNIVVHPDKFKTEVLKIDIPANSHAEYQATLTRGHTLLYSWSADGELYYDFYGSQNTAHPDFYTRYSDGNGHAHSGAIIAPYTGLHGWYWENLTEDYVTIRIEIAGYYDEIIGSVHKE